MADKSNGQGSTTASSGKKTWIEPKVEVAAGRAAAANLARPGGTDNFYYS